MASSICHVYIGEILSGTLACALKIFQHSFRSSVINRSHQLLLCLLFQVAEPMQMEFLKMKEARENPSEEMQSKS